MSRDDYISKLFIENQDKLNKAPSPNLWDRIETEMDKSAPVSQPESTAPTKMVSLTKYMAAASVAVVVTVGVWVFVQSQTKSTIDSPLAMKESMGPEILSPTTKALAEKVIISNPEALPINEEEAEAKLAVEDRVQEQRILEIAKQAKSTQIEIADKIEKIPLEEVSEVEDEVIASDLAPEPSYNASTSVEETQEKKMVKADVFTNSIPSPTTRNYAAPPALNSTSNQVLADEIVRNAEGGDVEQPTTTSSEIVATSRNNRVQSRKKANARKKNKKTAYLSPMATAHPRLKIFGWMLGKWIDDNEDGGISYEKWQLKNSNTLQGKGYKVSNQNERVFEELMQINYEPNLNQVFLTISLKETQEQLQYLLISFDNERIVFKQNSSAKHPDEVIIQRDLDGFTVIMVNNKGFLDGDQQRYLEHRNRVSNVRAIRTMRYEE